MEHILDRLAEVIAARLDGSPDSSYVARLRAKGVDAILKKVGEEATELVIAAKGGVREEMIHEAADLWFHTLVLLGAQGVEVRAVYEELERRFGRSGLEEKAARGSPS